MIFAHVRRVFMIFARVSRLFMVFAGLGRPMVFAGRIFMLSASLRPVLQF